MAGTSYNTIFTHRAFALGPAGVRCGSGEAFQFRGSGISRTHPHHLTASRPPFGLKVVGRREYITLSEMTVTTLKRGIILSDHWMVYFSKLKTVVRVDLGLVDIAPIDGANTLIKVEMKSRSIFSKKLNFELLGEAEDEIGILLTDDDIVVGAITYADAKSFYYYTKNKDSLFNMLNKVLSKYIKLKCVISTMDDPNWKYYLDNLYPDAFEIQRKTDR
jgi:hypothetical protein